MRARRQGSFTILETSFLGQPVTFPSSREQAAQGIVWSPWPENVSLTSISLPERAFCPELDLHCEHTCFSDVDLALPPRAP